VCFYKGDHLNIQNDKINSGMDGHPSEYSVSCSVQDTSTNENCFTLILMRSFLNVKLHACLIINGQHIVKFSFVLMMMMMICYEYQLEVLNMKQHEL
jgi:hypothetical protein